MILVIDNYDSFVYNLARYVTQLTNAPIQVTRNDKLDFDAEFDAVIISPGPCGPKQAGEAIRFVQKNLTRIPLLGICLGHQIIVESLGGSIQKHQRPRHGKSSEIFHDATTIFANVPSPFLAGRYHSLVANERQLPESLVATAHTKDSTVMAVKHVELPVFGLQFHPESVLTEHGYQILQNFLAIAGVATNRNFQKAIFS